MTSESGPPAAASAGPPAAAPAGLVAAAPAGLELRSPALSRSDVDRRSLHRDDEAWLSAAWSDRSTRVLVVQDGQAAVRSGQGAWELAFVPPDQAPAGIRFLLGVDPDGVAYFGVAGPVTASAEAAGVAGVARETGASGDGEARAVSLRQAGPMLSDRDAGLMTHAVALANWHAVFRHCPQCGAVTEAASAGHSRRCPDDGAEHFPRVDPAVIMLVTDSADRCLLARNAQWPQRRVSILAGFVEPGESAEQAVAREVLEETGVSVGQVRYLGSQPWPMPHSLMLGFRAVAVGSEQITVDSVEIAEAGWFSRDELRQAMRSGQILLPPPVSIAHRIIESWFGAELTGPW